MYDTLDAHVARAGDLQHACIPLGMLLAWCANLRLLSEAVEQEHGALLLRIRVREVTGAVLFTACGGTLSDALLNREGQAFIAGYYPQYLQDYASTFGADIYAVEDTWSNYELLAPVLTRALLGNPRTEAHPVRDWIGKVRSWWR